MVAWAKTRHRPDLAELLNHPDSEREKLAKAVLQAVEVLRHAPVVFPRVTDDVQKWLAPRMARALRAGGIKTLADLSVRIPRRRLWWTGIAGLGAVGARQIEAFFASHPQLTERARALAPMQAATDVVPWEVLRLPQQLDGTQGAFRSPKSACTLDADNDYAAVQTWLSLQESTATHRAYRKEAERLILWAIFERGRALSSLTVEDAVAYRAFLRRPLPAGRWIGPSQSRASPGWKPFAGPLSARSCAYALSVLGALFRWLMEQGYLLTNPFSGVKVRGASNSAPMDTGHVFSEGQWALIRTIADGLEWSYGWKVPAAQRLRFILDFSYATGLRASELVRATLRSVQTDSHDDHWLTLVGKGSKAGKVALPPLARSALNRYLSQRGLQTTPVLWKPDTALIGALRHGAAAGITDTRLRSLMGRFFKQAAELVDADNPGLAHKLRRASPHWMRHTHATHALGHGAELTTVRDNLRHASISTTSIYLHGDDLKRARQLSAAFAPRD
ncbi:phage integrase family protein [soil metagenome]